MKTLTDIGLKKQAEYFVASIAHASYENNGIETVAEIFKFSVEETKVRVYVLFDDSVSGSIGNVRLVNKDGDVIAISDRVFIKPKEKSLFVTFIYKFAEVEVDDIETL